MFAGLTLNGSAATPFDFATSKGRLGFFDIFDSAHAPPGRTVLEIVRRLFQRDPSAAAVVVSNPLLPVKSVDLLKWCGDGCPCPGVIVDQGGVPLAYVLPRQIVDEGLEKFLILLSSGNEQLDARLLGHLAGQEALTMTVEVPALRNLPWITSRGFFSHADKFAAWSEQCTAALRLIATNPGWRDLPFAAYHPYHAGDVLFFGLASRLTETNLYRRQVICKVYADIWADCGATMEMLPLDVPPPPQPRPADYQHTEGGLFFRDVRLLDQEVRDSNFITYARGSRDYNHSPFHLIDQARFALGQSISRAEDTFYARPPQVTHRCAMPRQPLRVLLCLQGGWALKYYPAADRRALIRGLIEAGCEVSVLDLPEAAAEGATVVSGGSTARLRGWLNLHHVFVGVDSFPHHFSRLVVGHPTVALFGSTWPGNSDAVAGYGYRTTGRGLPCAPCGEPDTCSTFGGSDCQNYAKPQDIVAAVLGLGDEVYQG
jgi:hypothetical protein